MGLTAFGKLVMAKKALPNFASPVRYVPTLVMDIDFVMAIDSCEQNICARHDIKSGSSYKEFCSDCLSAKLQ